MNKTFANALLLILLFSACTAYHPSQMLRTGPDFKYDQFSDTLHARNYQIAPNDKILIQLFTHNAESVFYVDPSLESDISGGGINNGIECLVEYDGTVKIPVLNRVKVSGYTVREVEKMLEEMYADYFNDPFVLIKVTNNRVIVFPGGEGGIAKVVLLQNSNTTLFEALAEAGGINDGRADKIKLIRGDLKNPEVYLIDLSTVDGMKQANLILQANDIIYVEPRMRLSNKLTSEIMPLLSFTASILVLITIASR